MIEAGAPTGKLDLCWLFDRDVRGWKACRRGVTFFRSSTGALLENTEPPREGPVFIYISWL